MSLKQGLYGGCCKKTDISKSDVRFSLRNQNPLLLDIHGTFFTSSQY